MSDQTETPSEHLRYTLLENGLDSINTALELLDEGDTDKLKLVVMLLGHGVELVLKARLMREHWSLVFEDPRNAALDKFEKGDFKSAGFDQCLKRLEDVCSIEFDKKHVAELKRLRDTRNRIEHFRVEIHVEEVEGAAHKALSFLFDFIHDHLEPITDGQVLLNKFRDGFASLGSMVDSRLAHIHERLEEARGDGSVIVDCLFCSQETAVVTGDDEVRCEFCRQAMSPEAMARDLIREAARSLSAKEAYSEDWGPWDCPNCDSPVMVSVSIGYVCLSCGEHWETLPSCDSCGQPFGGDDEILTCGNCLGARWDKS